MENELERKIAWLKKRHETQHKIVEDMESSGSATREELVAAKKEKLRLKDFIMSLENLTDHSSQES